ncbi:tyrosine-type recombinase/integrase [Chondrinema litorale]|uniref:tyrosine-type recombinase/integrase n=1 Tax=Chondrinema litorale TaxID=2994555 RepID=UPI002543D260|nr:tyrosine-type recombinase/integrase [Chondrinema litorale]UZR99083.1 tyrosine-type recombinase/integrase [Chondrinema litorale]
MKRVFKSIYANHLKEYIDLKKKLGFKYRTSTLLYLYIDELAYSRRESTIGITKAFANKWSQKRENESSQYHYNRVRHLIQFSDYLCQLGVDSYIPKLPKFPTSTFVPYIYSAKEMEALFQASDNLRLRVRKMDSSIFSFPTLLRVLFATGIRINEALALTDEDVNLEAAYLKITDCKNGKDRIIPIAPSLIAVCQQYLYYRNKLPLNSTPKHFFISLNGNKCAKGSSYNWFRACLYEAGIPYVGRHHGPRVHDLRHTFAVNALVSMVEAGIDMYVGLPILSNYLGHQSLGATEHYVRLTTAMFPDLMKEINTFCFDVFPKFKTHEESN